jgi:flavin-dependent dehydrogenase
MAADLQAGVFDAAVVGAGPAGSATARWLALQGWRVAMLERTRFEAPRIGESLPPNVQQPLRELGLWPDFLALAPLPSWGTCSLWGDAAQQSHSHLLSPYGCGWHVDRRAFDHMLAHAAKVAGARLREGVALRSSVYREGCWWLQTTPNSLQAETPEQVLCARVLIDATGRRAQVARTLGAQRMLFDRLVGVAMHWAGVDTEEQGRLLVESAREGWWYSAPLPGGAQHQANAMIAMLMTDADRCAQLRLSDAESWQAILQSTQATRARLGRAHCISTSQVHCAHSQRLRRDGASDAGPWLAVGDATLAVDPISGSGVLRALRTARAAADTVSELLARPYGWRETLAAYEDERDKEFTIYLQERAHYYAAEQRFDTPFWQRRQVLRRCLTDAADRTLAAATA